MDETENIRKLVAYILTIATYEDIAQLCENIGVSEWWFANYMPDDIVL